MSPNDVLRIAGSELDRLSQELISGRSTSDASVTTLDSLTSRFIELRQDPCSHRAELRDSLLAIQKKTKRLQSLLEAGTLFHCHCILGRPETPDTYGSDGTFNASQDSRIVFQG